MQKQKEAKSSCKKYNSFFSAVLQTISFKCSGVSISISAHPSSKVCIKINWVGHLKYATCFRTKSTSIVVAYDSCLFKEYIPCDSWKRPS